MSDDGSTDRTLAILNRFQATLAPGQMSILAGPRRGFAANFMRLLLNPSIEGDYYAFCDQDDFWCKEKLFEAVSKLRLLSTAEDNATVYASARSFVDDDLKLINTEATSHFVPSFNNALVQNIAAGNTIVLNNAMRVALLNIGEVDVVSHDWWVYMVCTGIGGCFYYDNTSYLLYRQHLGNVIGSGASLKSRLSRFKELLQGCHRCWTDINIEALNTAKAAFTEENRITLERFVLLRDKPAIRRVFELLQNRIRRQSWFGTVGLLLACLFNKI